MQSNLLSYNSLKVYQITFAYYDKKCKSLSNDSATVYVVVGKADIKAHDTEIYVKATWDLQAVFDKYIDAQGNSEPYSKVKVSGEVNANKEKTLS